MRRPSTRLPNVAPQIPTSSVKYERLTALLKKSAPSLRVSAAIDSSKRMGNRTANAPVRMTLSMRKAASLIPKPGRRAAFVNGDTLGAADAAGRGPCRAFQRQATVEAVLRAGCVDVLAPWACDLWRRRLRDGFQPCFGGLLRLPDPARLPQWPCRVRTRRRNGSRPRSPPRRTGRRCRCGARSYCRTGRWRRSYDRTRGTRCPRRCRSSMFCSQRGWAAEARDR